MKRNTLNIERIFDVDIALIWQCWSDPEFIKKWYGADPNGTVAIADIDFREGGLYTITFTDSDQTVHTGRGKHLNIEPFKNIRLTLEWVNEPGQISELNIDFISLNGKTKMIFTQSGIQHPTIHDYEYGWNNSFNKMEKIFIDK